MTIALNIGPSGALSSYGELVDEIRDQLDDGQFSETRILRAIRKAEAHFNRELRVPEMEASAVLNVTGEIAALPDGFLEMRSIYLEGNPDYPLRGMSPTALTGAFNGLGGIPQAYAIVGRTVKFAPFGAAQIVVDYYTVIPGLDNGTPSNWLLRKHPDLYVSAVLFHLHRRSGDEVAADRRLAETQGMIESLTIAGNNARYGAGPLVPLGIMQVRGVRA